MKKQQYITTQTNTNHLLSENKLKSNFKTTIENFLWADALECYIKNSELKIGVWEEPHKWLF